MCFALNKQWVVYKSFCPHHAPDLPDAPQAPTKLLTQFTLSLLSVCSSAVLNGSSHSPTSLNGAPSTPNGFSNGPAMSSTASLSNQQLPPACGARQLCKLKRFLTTLQQFGNDISPEIGERVRSLVLGLVVSSGYVYSELVWSITNYCTSIRWAVFIEQLIHWAFFCKFVSATILHDKVHYKNSPESWFFFCKL